MSIKQAEEFLKKIGPRKRISKFEKYKADIAYLHSKGSTLEVITQYLETKGIKRTKGYNALSSYIKRNLVDDIMKLQKTNTDSKSQDQTASTDDSTGWPTQTTSETQSSVDCDTKKPNKSRRHVSSPSTRETRANYKMISQNQEENDG